MCAQKGGMEPKPRPVGIVSHSDRFSYTLHRGTHTPVQVFSLVKLDLVYGERGETERLEYVG